MGPRKRKVSSEQPVLEHSRRSRGFGGCTACRQRRLKCDEGRPCSMCRSWARTCTYEKNLFFGLDDHCSSEPGRYRRPILTEDERRLMSTSLTESVGEQSALDLVLAVESECEATPLSGNLQIRRGPFGAFRSAEPIREPNSDNVSAAVGTNTSTDNEAFDFNSFSVDQVASPDTLALTSALFDQPDTTAMQPSFRDPCGLFDGGSRVQEVFDDITLPEMQHFPFERESFVPYGRLYATFDDTCPPPSVSAPGNVGVCGDLVVPSDAVPLLKHYQTTVLRSLTPFRHSKTPWHVLFLPQAKSCLAALTLGEAVDSATLCSFYGTLAISAFSLSGTSLSTKWKDLAESYKQLARNHIKATLQNAYDTPKKAKYKAILIALLTMVQLSVISGNSDASETYFLEAEKFIRLRGLNRKKSRKVRLLHHCYAFERILYESTLSSRPSGSHRNRVRAAIEASGTIVVGQDALSFRLSQWTDLENAMRRIKGQEEGENDLHLQRPGSWSATLYPEIFGVPESMLIMISLILRLAKERDNDYQGTGLRLKEFLDRAKAIEQLIHGLEPLSSGTELDNLQRAMHLALTIYFYRKIYDVEASILQDKVTGVLSCLQQAQGVQPDNAFGAARYNWPAFVAAGEAKDPFVQSSFSAWFTDAAKQTGLRLFIIAMEKAQRLWEANSSCRSVWPSTPENIE